MPKIALETASQAGFTKVRPFAWPGADDAVRLPRGRLCEGFIRGAMDGHLLGCERTSLVAELDGSQDLILLAPDPGEVRPTALDGALMLDVALVVLDLLQRGGGVAPVNARVILERKGYRRWGRERQAFERKITGQLHILQRFAVARSDGVEPLFRFSARNVARTDFKVWASTDLSAEIEAENWAHIDVAVLRLDHRANRGADVLAKKLAVAIAQDGGRGRVLLGDLLTRVGAIAKEGCGPHNVPILEHCVAALERLDRLGLVHAPAARPLQRAQPDRRWLQAEIQIQSDPYAIHLHRAAPAAQTPPKSANDSDLADLVQPPGKRRGRPPFEPNPEQRCVVSALYASGATREQIARVVGVSLPTLRRTFASEFREIETAGLSH